MVQIVARVQLQGLQALVAFLQALLQAAVLLAPCRQLRPVLFLQ